MELLDHVQIRPDLPRIPPTMRLGGNAARVAVALPQGLDKAQTHPKEAGQVPLCAFSALKRAHDLKSKIGQ
jgi:hypothetical protein